MFSPAAGSDTFGSGHAKYGNWLAQQLAAMKASIHGAGFRR
jgi:hypothetical protein